MTLFYFQVMESTTPLNIPVPTPAPDRGGHVACLSGPIACQENYKETIQVFSLSCLGHVYGKFMELIGFKALGNYSASS